MIKYIVHTISSFNDYYGNTYRFARITSTKTGKSLIVSPVGGENNAASLLFHGEAWNRKFSQGIDGKPFVKDWREIYSVQSWEKKREWQRLERYAGTDGSPKVYEGDVTATMIRRLNRKDK
jgi:hypothetical protein